MGLIINQGIHKEDTPITSDYETGKITKVELADSKVRENSLNVETTIIGKSKYKGRKLTDLVPFDPEDPMSFKYKQIRKAVGKAYDKDEGTKIDIQKILLNKAVGLKLSVREYQGNDYQNIKYMPLEKKNVTPVDTEDEAQEEAAPKANTKAPEPEPEAEAQDTSELDELAETEEAEEKPKKPSKEKEKPLPEPSDDVVSDDDFPF